VLAIGIIFAKSKASYGFWVSEASGDEYESYASQGQGSAYNPASSLFSSVSSGFWISHINPIDRI
jgi:hypothetical protein